MEFIYRTEDALFPIRFPKGFEGYVKSLVCDLVIYNRFKKRAFCSNCESVFSYDAKIKSGTFEECPKCGKRKRWVPHTADNLSRSEVLFMWNEDDCINFTIITAYWTSEKKEDIEKFNLSIQIYPEEMGQISRKKQYAALHWGRSHWVTCMPIYVHKDLDYANWFPDTKAVLQRSFLKHSVDGVYNTASTNDFIKKLSLYAKYPQAEYIYKQGFGDLINKKIWNIPTYIRPNWKAKNLAGFFRLSHQDLDKLKQWGMYNIEDIALYLMLKKHYKKITKGSIHALKKGVLAISDFYRDFAEFDPIKITKYLTKVHKENEPGCIHGRMYYSVYTTKRTYLDYVEQLKKMDYPLNDYYLYPKDFRTAHDQVSAEYNEMLQKEQAKKNREANKQFKKRLEILETMCYEAADYIIRPLRSKEEFVDEGKNNRNCVARYFERALRGSTNIFVIRKAESPKISYVTVELNKAMNKILQCYSAGNSIPPQDVREFADYWLENIVKAQVKKGNAA